MRIDLDAARAARMEAEGDPHELVAFGATYQVPAEAPWEFVYRLARGQTPQALEAVLGDGWKAISSQASKNDVVELTDQLCSLWGLGTTGERQASGSTSSNDGNSSRPTSSGSTGSTSQASGEDG